MSDLMPGNRVFVVLQSTLTTIQFLGFGEYQGKQMRPEVIDEISRNNLDVYDLCTQAIMASDASYDEDTKKILDNLKVNLSPEVYDESVVSLRAAHERELERPFGERVDEMVTTMFCSHKFRLDGGDIVWGEDVAEWGDVALWDDYKKGRTVEIVPVP